MAKDIKNVEYGLEKIFAGAQDFLPLLGTDYVEFYVGNAKQAAHFYKTAFGFQSHAYAGLETGVKDTDTIERTFVTPGVKRVKVTVSDGYYEFEKEWTINVVNQKFIPKEEFDVKVYVIDV